MTFIQEKKISIKHAIRSKCNIYKEELMANVWHPTRVQKLLDNGIEFEDM